MRWISKKHKELARKVKTSNAECGEPWARLLMNYSVRLGNKIPFSQKVNQSPIVIQLTKTLLEALWKRCSMPPALLGLPQRGRGYRASTQITPTQTHRVSPEPGVIWAMRSPGNSRREDLGAREAVLQRLLWEMLELNLLGWVALTNRCRQGSELSRIL